MRQDHPEALEITLDGEAVQLRLGPAAFRLAELKYKLTFTQAELSTPSFAVMAKLAYVACLPSNPKLKEEQFIVKMANSDEYAIMEQVQVAMARMTDGVTRSSEPTTDSDEEAVGE